MEGAPAKAGRASATLLGASPAGPRCMLACAGGNLGLAATVPNKYLSKSDLEAGVSWGQT